MTSRTRTLFTVFLLMPVLVSGYFLGDFLVGHELNRLNLDARSPEVRTALIDPVVNYRFLYSTLACIVFGLYRIVKVHPFTQKKYAEWLRTTPWTARLALPLGRVNLTWRDGIFLAGAVLLAHHTTTYSAAWPIVAFAVPYMMVLMASFVESAGGAACVLAFSFGGVVRAWEHPWVIVGVLAAMYCICLMALPRSLNKQSWIGDLETRKKRIEKVGWPFDNLGPMRPQPEMPFSSIILITMLAGWWVYCLAYQIEIRSPDMSGQPVPELIAAGGLIAFVRLVAYLAGYVWPISFLGRIATGRWIIPSFDRVFIAPLCTALAGVVLGTIPLPSMISPAVYCGVSVGILLCMAIGMRPSLQTWRLTGGHRIFPTGSGSNNRNAAAMNRQVARIVKTTA